MSKNKPYNQIDIPEVKFESKPWQNAPRIDPRITTRSFYKVGTFDVTGSSDIELDIGFTPKLLTIKSASGSFSCDSSTSFEEGGVKYLEYGIRTSVSEWALSAGDVSSIINCWSTVANVARLNRNWVTLNISAYSSSLECVYVAIW